MGKSIYEIENEQTTLPRHSKREFIKGMPPALMIPNMIDYLRARLGAVNVEILTVQLQDK